MGRSVIKENPLGAEWNSGDMLEKDERFQTDAEWHGELLEDISSKLENIEGVLHNMDDNLRYMRDFYERNPQPYVIEKTETSREPWWRFIFNWVMFLVVVGIIAEALSK